MMTEQAPGRPPVRSVVRSGGRAIVVVVVAGIGAIGVALLTAVRGPGRTRRGTIALQGLSRMTLCALGVRVVSQGAVRSGPSLVVANRLCWLDVLVLAAAGPMVPLADSRVTQSSPIASIAARVGAVFVGVTSPRQLPGTVEEITATLRGGHRVLVFPEGDKQFKGNNESFHRAVFQSAVDAATVISPVALRYRGPSFGAVRFDDPLLGSLWCTLRGGPRTVLVQWLPVIPAVASTGHRSDHRAAAAVRAEWAIAHALGAPARGLRAVGRAPAPALLSSARQAVPVQAVPVQAIPVQAILVSSSRPVGVEMVA